MEHKRCFMNNIFNMIKVNEDKMHHKFIIKVFRPYDTIIFSVLYCFVRYWTYLKALFTEIQHENYWCPIHKLIFLLSQISWFGSKEKKKITQQRSYMDHFYDHSIGFSIIYLFYIWYPQSPDISRNMRFVCVWHLSEQRAQF